ISRVRLLGVGMPETEHAGGCRHLRKRFLGNLLKEQLVRMESDPRNQRTEGGCPLVHLYRESDGLWVNLNMGAEGYGAAKSSYPCKDQDLFRAAEHDARAEERGVWSSENLASASSEYDHTKAEMHARQFGAIARTLEAKRRRQELKAKQQRLFLEEMMARQRAEEARRRRERERDDK